MTWSKEDLMMAATAPYVWQQTPLGYLAAYRVWLANQRRINERLAYYARIARA